MQVGAGRHHRVDGVLLLDLEVDHDGARRGTGHLDGRDHVRSERHGCAPQPEGVGELQLEMERLKLKLEREGLFEPSRKRPLPEYPRRIGVVTSPSGAVWQDIQTVTARRYPLVELALAPAAVQGEKAAETIVEALEALDEDPDIDVVIVARGGGSLEDLWPFNEETVARAIFASSAPVISAVGHETDVTIADLVADLRESKARPYTERDTPIFTCIHRPVEETLGLLG